MDKTEALAQLAHAQRLTATSRAAAGWYARYLVVLGIASFALAASFAVVDPRTVALVITPIWLLFVLGLTIGVVLRRKTAVRGYATIHSLVMTAWSVAWVLTVSLTTSSGGWGWPILGGGVMASAAFAGAYVAHRRSRA
jgi:hypothetical protein